MSQISIFSWNVNGIRAVINKGEFDRFINKFQPDILLLQETKAQKDQVEIDLPNYTEYWNSADKKGYSGTAIFSKMSAINTNAGLPDDITSNYELSDNYGTVDKEGRVLLAEYDKFFILSVYSPNIKDGNLRIKLRQQFDMALLEYLKRLDQSKPVIFGGDLNVAHREEDLARPKENIGKKGFTKEERSGFKQFIKAGFIDTFRIFNQGNGYYTWWTHWANARARNIGWRIDYLLVSSNLKDQIIEANIHPEVMGSDHCPASIVLRIN